MERRSYTNTEIEQKLEALPGHVKDFVYSNEIDAVVQKIGQKNQLHIDQMGLLQAEVTDVIMGTTEPNDFVPYMMETLQIDQPKAEAIAKDANELLFEKIRQAMRDGTPLTSSTSSPAQPSATPASTPTSAPTPTVPQREFPKADVMLTQKTVTPPASAFGAMSIHEAAVVVPPKLGALTTPPPPTMSKVPGTFVTTPAQPASRPMSALASAPTIPPAPTPESTAPISSAPASAPTPGQNGYKVDPYREPIE